MLQPGLYQKVHYTLRIAVAMCFIGHGSFGIITKQVWCNYFGVFGIGQNLSYQMMPVLGCFDILLGIIMLIYPVRIILAWLVFWGIVTALLRPLSGEPFAEFIERAGNFGVPLVLLFLAGGSKNIKGWFTRINPFTQLTTAMATRATTCLKIIVFLLLLGHGWLNIIGKSALLKQYTALGFSNPVEIAEIIGVAEIAGGLMVLIKPYRPVLLALFIWKMGSELFYPHYAMFEWIERGGSYGAILALWLLTEKQPAFKFITGGKYVPQKTCTTGSAAWINKTGAEFSYKNFSSIFNIATIVKVITMHLIRFLVSMALPALYLRGMYGTGVVTGSLQNSITYRPVSTILPMKDTSIEE